MEKNLIIEVDGQYHNIPEQKIYDEQRSAKLTELGYLVLRFPNEEVIGNIDEILNKIKAYCDTEVPSLGGDLGEVVVFTTRADTIYGVTFMVLAPESEYVAQVTTPEQKTAVEEYVAATKKRTERERQIDKKVSGVFTGAYAINPVSGEEIPIWIADYVLAGYGTGAIMAVPAHDSRDYAFAKHFNLPVIPLIEGADVSEESYDAKDGIMMNSPSKDLILHSPFSILHLNGLSVKEAIAATKKYIEETGIGRVKVNYRLRDAIFSRQRYWGEPFPVYYKDGLPYMLPFDKLPLELPEVDKFLPTETGEPPLGRAKDWVWEKSK
jgi:leucyl-tRNA synthetase